MGNIILVAEDYDDTRDCMVFILKSYGFTVHEAANGQQAVEIAKAYHPHVILMDISMPVMDGLEATRLIRKSGNGISHTPIIAVTAFHGPYQEKALEAGCNEVLTKPLDFDALEAVVKKYLSPALPL